MSDTFDPKAYLAEKEQESSNEEFDPKSYLAEKEEPMSALETGISEFGRGASYGLSDRAVAGVGSLIDKGFETPEESPRSISDLYSENLKKYREKIHAGEEANPGTAITMGIAGGLVSPINKIMPTFKLPLPNGVIKNMNEGVLNSIAPSIAATLGFNEKENVGDIASDVGENVLSGATLGAKFGAGISALENRQPVMEALKKGYSKVASKTGDVLEKMVLNPLETNIPLASAMKDVKEYSSKIKDFDNKFENYVDKIDDLSENSVTAIDKTGKKLIKNQDELIKEHSKIQNQYNVDDTKITELYDKLNEKLLTMDVNDKSRPVLLQALRKLKPIVEGKTIVKEIKSEVPVGQSTAKLNEQLELAKIKDQLTPESPAIDTQALKSNNIEAKGENKLRQLDFDANQKSELKKLDDSIETTQKTIENQHNLKLKELDNNLGTQSKILNEEYQNKLANIEKERLTKLEGNTDSKYIRGVTNLYKTEALKIKNEYKPKLNELGTILKKSKEDLQKELETNLSNLKNEIKKQKEDLKAQQKIDKIKYNTQLQLEQQQKSQQAYEQALEIGKQNLKPKETSSLKAQELTTDNPKLNAGVITNEQGELIGNPMEVRPEFGNLYKPKIEKLQENIAPSETMSLENTVNLSKDLKEIGMNLRQDDKELGKLVQPYANRLRSQLPEPIQKNISDIEEFGNKSETLTGTPKIKDTNLSETELNQSTDKMKSNLLKYFSTLGKNTAEGKAFSKEGQKSLEYFNPELVKQIKETAPELVKKAQTSVILNPSQLKTANVVGEEFAAYSNMINAIGGISRLGLKLANHLGKQKLKLKDPDAFTSQITPYLEGKAQGKTRIQNTANLFTIMQKNEDFRKLMQNDPEFKKMIEEDNAE